MSIERWFTHTVSVKRKTPALNASQQIAMPSETTVSSALKCLVEPIKTAELNSILGRLPDARRRLSCAYGTDLQDGDIITHGTARYIAAETMPDNMSPGNQYITCLLREGPSA